MIDCWSGFRHNTISMVSVRTGGVRQDVQAHNLLSSGQVSARIADKRNCADTTGIWNIFEWNRIV